MSEIFKTPHIETEKINGILRIKFNRLDKRNSLSREMYAALRETFISAENDGETRVLFLSGDETCFTAGNDLKDFQAAASGNRSTEGEDFIRTLGQTKLPLVAAVGGPAIGIGTTILLHCDLVYAGEKAMFRLPFVNLGLCPEAGSSYLLPKLTGYQTAAELLLLGEFFDAKRAHEIGLVSQIFPEKDLLASAWQQAEKLAAQPYEALLLTKRLMKKGSNKILKETMDEELIHFAQRLLSPEAKVAFAAFFDKE